MSTPWATAALWQRFRSPRANDPPQVAHRRLLTSETIDDVLRGVRSAAEQYSGRKDSNTVTSVIESVISFFRALYSIPCEEQNDSYTSATALSHARSRVALEQWLEHELEKQKLTPSPSLSWEEKLLHYILNHQLSDAQREAVHSSQDERLARMLRLHERGPKHAGLVRFKPNIPIQVVSAIVGKVDCFISSPQFLCNEIGGTQQAPLQATWRQLLGLFCFFSADPSDSAEDIIIRFLGTIRSPLSKRKRCLPSYAENVVRAKHGSRESDMISYGSQHEDCLVGLLESFARCEYPSPEVMHPGSADYYGQSLLAQFVIAVFTRAVYGDACDERTDAAVAYRQAEGSMLAAFTYELLSQRELRDLALVPLNMLLAEDPSRDDLLQPYKDYIFTLNASRSPLSKASDGQPKSTKDFGPSVAFLAQALDKVNHRWCNER
jgi:nuclear pore complex protein Nup98-Nup96